VTDEVVRRPETHCSRIVAWAIVTLLQQKELRAYCIAQGIHVTAYAPLGSGDRPAFIKAPDAPVLLDNPVIRSIAEAHERTSAQVLLAWHVQQGISAIPKSVLPRDSARIWTPPSSRSAPPSSNASPR
jgi:diketogulonate reductase-like aldo/keto reductase